MPFQFLSFLFINIVLISALPLPFDEYSFVLARNRVKQMDRSDFYTSQAEKTVSLYFEKLKYDEFGGTSVYFYPARPIETDLELITKTTLYNQLKKVPKGGNLHIHDNQMLNRRTLLEIIQNSPSGEFDLLYICDKTKPICSTTRCTCSDFYLRYFYNEAQANDGWVKVKGSPVWTIDAILNKTTLIGILNNLENKIYPTDTAGRWAVANTYGVFNFYSDLINYNVTRFQYLKACLDKSYEENVQLIEFRRSNFGSLFAFNSSGDRVLISSAEELRLIVHYKEEYLKQNLNFIDFIYLISGSRRNEKNVIKADLESSIKSQAMYPDLIRGFDLVGEEDQGHTLLFHSKALIEGFNYSYNSNNTFGFEFHTAETNWPNDFRPAKYGDDGSTLDNIYDAIVFKTHRVGHGIGFVKHPNIYPLLKERQIAIEACPASNQILGYIADLRNHPAINYYRSGIPIVIAGDDPGSFGYNDLTVDYYLAFMAWGLSLYDIREIANNSIRYSAIPDLVRSVGFAKFKTQWDTFIASTYSDICKNSYDPNKINITNIYPSYGPNDYASKFTLFGYGLENAFCKDIKCVFGNVETSGRLNKLNELECDTPLGMADNQLVDVSVRIGDVGVNTGKQYKFVPSSSIHVIDDKTTTPVMTTKANSASRLNFQGFGYFIIVLVSLMLN